MNDPLFDAVYNSPEDLMRNEAGGKSQLDLLSERIRNSFLYKQETLDSIIQKTTKDYTTTNEVLALAIDLKIPEGLIQATTPVNMVMQLIDQCRQRNKLEELVDMLQQKNPTIIHQ